VENFLFIRITIISSHVQLTVITDMLFIQYNSKYKKIMSDWVAIFYHLLPDSITALVM